VWEVDDDRSTLLLLTLNRVQGEDDPQRRGELLRKQGETRTLAALAERLPEDARKLRRLMESALPPAPLAPPPDPAALPQAVTFFLMERQRRALLAKLAAFGRDRSAALLRALEIPEAGDE
jgi:hypothetical protein